MWRRTYLLLLLVRIYFAVSPSYIHPDENFQGPEVIAGEVFEYPHLRTWEFTTTRPVRSLFPLWPVYGLPMLVLQWVGTETGSGAVAPHVIYYTLRLMMFILSFVLEDWAIHELVPSPRQRTSAVVLVASSYVTWTYQTHTFSNAVETLVVLWSIVMIQRILDNRHRSSLLSSAVLGSLLAFGVFNRITFPAFLLPPLIYLMPHFLQKPFCLFATAFSFLLTSFLTITIDTFFYNPPGSSLAQLLRTNAIVTPLNSIRYNASAANLSLHGLHPPYQHLVASLPLLLGPALLLLHHIRKPTLSILSAFSATILLSLIPHQEPRFLLPVVPLLLSSVRLPSSAASKRYWFGTWIVFNAVLGVLMGVYHQGGVVPAQLWLGQQQQQERGTGVMEVFWWRTYSPPMWLLGGQEVVTVDLMGMNASGMMDRLTLAMGECGERELRSIGLVAPTSSIELDSWRQQTRKDLLFERQWMTRRHVNLDDLDMEQDGVRGTLTRVMGRRGLAIWKISRLCADSE
ncbi:MAG: hypothetical protein LQ352_000373 [Teloschistes flavicans]|nr:MAG: hypothetical protein LQ352_000373 [Teloschistes flavicans]